MSALFFVVEGVTEKAFVDDVLASRYGGIPVSTPNLRGRVTFTRLEKDVRILLRRPGAVVTTMVDLYALPPDFPGRERADKDLDPLGRASILEQAFLSKIGDERFVPYLQVHEFEALLFTNLIKLADLHPKRSRQIQRLAARTERDFRSPEHVNREMPPSYRIKQAVPEYNKVVDGPATAREIGLDRLRQSCRHFREWLEQLDRRTHTLRAEAR